MLPSLTIPFENFKARIESIAKNADEIINSRVAGEIELSNFKSASEIWVNSSLEYINKSFSESSNWFVRQFIAGPDGFSVPGKIKRPWQDEINLERLKIKNRRTNLITNLRLVEACDVIQPRIFDEKIRKAYTMREKSDFVLQKLYCLTDDYYYSINILIEGNGLLVRNSSEVIEMAKLLEENGLINTIGGTGGYIAGKITVPGSIYVEEKLQKYSENYDDITSDAQTLEAAIEHIKEELNKLGLGQEIIFNEIDELKQLHQHLNNKHFGQLLKGKLIDLALAKMVENDTISFMYHELTGHALKLIN